MPTYLIYEYFFLYFELRLYPDSSKIPFYNNIWLLDICQLRSSQACGLTGALCNPTKSGSEFFQGF